MDEGQGHGLDVYRYAMAVSRALELFGRMQRLPGWPRFQQSFPSALKTDLGAWKDRVGGWFEADDDSPFPAVPWSYSRSPSARAQSDQEHNPDEESEPLSEHRE